MTDVNLTANITEKITKNNQEKTITKPKIITIYTKYTKGVDLCNQISTQYRFLHRSKKWWKPIFYHIMQICISNNMIIVKLLARKSNIKTFLKV